MAAASSTPRNPLSLAGSSPFSRIAWAPKVVRFTAMGVTNSSERPDHESIPTEPDGQRAKYVVVGDLRSKDDEDTCLRPLGLCELGGACESCWYRPDHPRFQDR